MTGRVVCSASIVVVSGILVVGVPSVAAAEKLFITKLHNREVIEKYGKGPSKLSPALLATKDGGGTLLGVDQTTGRPVIAVNSENMKKLGSSRAVRAIHPVGSEWGRPQRPRLKLSYKENNRPTAGELERLGLKQVEDYPLGAFMIVEPFRGRIDAALAAKLFESPKVRYVAPSFKVKVIQGNGLLSRQEKERKQTAPPPTNDPDWGKLWGMVNIGTPAAWKTVSSSPIVVAVVDTGVDYQHEDLQANMWTDDKGKHGYNFVQNNADPRDLNGHGTRCAGIIGAVGNNGKGVVGVNWQVKIMAVKWLDAGGMGELKDAIKGIDYAIKNKAKVINLSWFSEDDPDLKAALERADKAGILVVACASNHKGDNDDPDTEGRFPSAYAVKNIIAVLAINKNHPEDLWPDSSYGKTKVHLGAPGDGIFTTIIKKYGYESGTSMAAAHVAGAAALIWAHPKHQQALHTEIKRLIVKHARRSPKLTDRCVSGGTLDISFLKKKK